MKAALSLCGGSGVRVVFTLTEGQWIATPARGSRCQRSYFYHEESEVIGVLILSLRGGRQDDAAIHCVLEDAGGLSVRVLIASGSPRATPSR
jgi:hypothetical protein